MCCARLVREFHGANPRMNLVQVPVCHLGDMTTKKCSKCQDDWTRAGFSGWQWAKRDKRTCIQCANHSDDRTSAAAPGIPSSSPAGQHAAHTSAAPASAGAVGESVAAPLPCPVRQHETADFLPGGGGGGGGAGVPSAVSGPSTPFHGHCMPVVWLDACMHACIYMHDCVMRAMGFCAGALP